MDIAKTVLIVGVVLFTLIGAVVDSRSKRLPNYLTVTSLLLALIYHTVNGAWQGSQSETGWLMGAGSELLMSVAGFFTGFSILFVLWLIGGGGGGDVKMMAALGAWLLPQATLYVFVISVLFVIMGSLGVLLVQIMNRGYSYVQRRYMHNRTDAEIKRDKSLSRDKGKAELELKTRRRLMPYGVPLALATWCVLAATHGDLLATLSSIRMQQ